MTSLPSLHSLKTFTRCFWPLCCLVLVLQMGVRLLLLCRESHEVTWGVFPLLQLLSVGLLYDLVALAWGLLPIMLCRLLWQPSLRVVKLCYWLGLYVLIFTAVAEWLFWEEFQTRFNFIAVDYLVYTHELIGNIRESYPLPLLLSVIAAAASLLFFLTHRTVLRTEAHGTPTSFRERLTQCGVILLLLAGSVMFVGDRPAELSPNSFHNELAKNGYYSLFSAFRTNGLSYDRFYATLPETEALAHLRQLPMAGQQFVSADLKDLRRIVHTGKKQKRHNVIFVVMESMSARFMQHFGATDHLTPNLDRLAKESLFFTQLYATGTRTVRGLEALTLSLPPIPGSSVLKRMHNEDRFSLGSLFRERGYDTAFIYGGFGYFDNMNYFFEKNGFNTVDRGSLSAHEIHFANIWGVCDEDLFARVIQEGDRAFQERKPFMHMVMTTSNHRPYTFPEHKIDIPSHSGRGGGVKYADYAVGELIKAAKTKPWFRNTLFVFVADHTAGGAGRAELALEKYHIPAMIYAPYLLAPREIPVLASQIDLPTTVLGLLGGRYISKFYGQDLLASPTPRAFISTYQKLGYVTDHTLTVLKPVKQTAQYRMGDRDQTLEMLEEKNRADIKDAIGYFQIAAEWETYSGTTSSLLKKRSAKK